MLYSAVQVSEILHLSGDMETAIKVGSRHGKPVVYRVASGQMPREDYVFYRSVNGVRLTKEVPIQYLEKAEQEV